ncbi:MAG: hypothetical protein HY347_00825 [candidate division NC10 bacterium]|nr:hypothetical protein [candidate division NC10 bacterium]
MNVRLKTKVILGGALMVTLAILAGSWLHIAIMARGVGAPWDFLFTLPLFLLVLLVPLWLALERWIFRPLARLEQSNRQVAQGNLEGALIPDEAIPENELGALIQSRNMMLKSLLMHQEHLEVANVQLREALHRAEAASRAKSEFLANMSHELRTPLNPIIGFSEILQDQTVGPLNEKQARYVANIHKSGQHLLALINDLLDLSKVEAGRLDLRPQSFDLREALTETLIAIRLQADAKGLQLELSVDPALTALTADPVRVKQILDNLLSNAVKFTPDGGRVRVTAKLVARGSWLVERTPNHEPRTTSGDFVEIAVQDTGIGIRAEDLGQLFQPFAQLEEVYSKRYQGTGLGLALTKWLVELHGGTIWAESQGEGQGSTFTVRLPLAPSG